MNYLQLCQRAAREAGINLNGPTSTVGNDGTEYQRVIDWVQDAYQDIQRANDDWRFMWNEFTLNTTASDGKYAATEVATAGTTLARYEPNSLRCYLQASGQSTEQRMYWYDYDQFRDIFLYGTARTQTGYPLYFTEDPARNLLLAPIPDAIYVVTGEYWRGVDTLSGDSDTPVIPEDYHMLIVWWALWKYAGFDESSAQYAHAQTQMKNILGRMERNERPHLRISGSLV